MTDKHSISYLIQCGRCGTIKHLVVDGDKPHGKKLYNLLEDAREHKLAHPTHDVLFISIHTVIEAPQGRLGKNRRQKT